MATEHPKPTHSRFKDLTGQRFGRLLVLHYVRNPKSTRAFWLCRCDCGASRTVNGNDLRRGATLSCGCHQHDVVRQRNFKHGCGGHNDGRTPEYKVWAEMKSRCTNPNHSAFKDYGGRGIRVCDRWLNSFENFLADMGLRPSPKHSIDRKDNDGNYEPGNCRWATRHEQNSNQRPRRKGYRHHSHRRTPTLSPAPSPANGGRGPG